MFLNKTTKQKHLMDEELIYLSIIPRLVDQHRYLI